MKYSIELAVDAKLTLEQRNQLVKMLITFTEDMTKVIGQAESGTFTLFSNIE